MRCDLSLVKDTPGNPLSVQRGSVSAPAGAGHLFGPLLKRSPNPLFLHGPFPVGDMDRPFPVGDMDWSCFGARCAVLVLGVVSVVGAFFRCQSRCAGALVALLLLLRCWLCRFSLLVLFGRWLRCFGAGCAVFVLVVLFWRWCFSASVGRAVLVLALVLCCWLRCGGAGCAIVRVGCVVVVLAVLLQC